MRIYGPNGTTLGAPSTAPRRSASGAFTLPEMETPSGTRPAASARGVGSIDALMALQGVEDPLERRKRAVRHGRSALDVLDDLKLGLLSGSLNNATIGRLRQAAADLKNLSGEAGLDQVLAEIELRVEVELAKAGQP